ncbi:MAG: TlpA disulfide reductase family protein [Bacteroidota bacterium]
MKKKHIEWAVFLIAIFLLFYPPTGSFIRVKAQQLLLATGLMNANPDDPEDSKGGEVYELSLTGMDGKKLDTKTLEGKTVFINFWATWCPPCVAEMPEIHDLYEKMDAEKVAFLMISLDKSPEKAFEFMERKGYSFPVYFPIEGLPVAFESGSIPTTFVVSPEGKIVYRRDGIASYDTEEFRHFLMRFHE